MLTRYPRPGRVKSRLADEFGPAEAARIHAEVARFCAREMAALQATREAAVDVWHEGGSTAEMRTWLGPGLRPRRQPAGDFGSRLRAAFETAFGEGAERVVAVGSDCPALTADGVRRALAALNFADLVLGPACDGGYYLIGSARRSAARVLGSVFEGVDWGTDRVLARALEIAERGGLRTATLETLADIDRPEDVAAWQALRAECEAERISVIVPTLNEEPVIVPVVERALAEGASGVIVADGGSADATRELAAEAGARVIEAPKGRARQMNAGAAVALGDTLAFLHADTSLPRGWEASVLGALTDPTVAGGAFDFVVDPRSLSLAVVDGLGRWRSRWTRLPLRDQGLFLRSRIFRALGGFPDIPVMEDAEFARRLRTAHSASRRPSAPRQLRPG